MPPSTLGQDRAITMRKHQYYRASVSIEELVNGYYTVRVNERWEGGAMPEPVVYSNMTWAEVKDVLWASFDVFSDSRTRGRHQGVVTNWNQASIFD